MSYNELNERLKQLRVEEFVWIIYIGIIILNWYANTLERKYFIFNDLESKDKYRKIMILIFSILIVVYLYFLKDSFDSLKTPNQTNKQKNLNYLSFIGSLLIAISGFIFLYIVIQDEQIDVELAFN